MATNNNPTNFRTLYFSKADLLKAVNAFPDAGTIVLGVENGQFGESDVRILWADNCQSGKSREVVIINEVEKAE